MSACGMPQGNHASKIQPVGHRHQAKMVGAARDVLQSSGPTAARVSNPAVLETPGGDSGGRQCSAKMTDIFQVVPGSPESAMDHDHDRMKSCVARKTKIPKLQRVRSIGNAFHELGPPTQEKFAEQGRTLGLTYTGKYFDAMVEPGVCQHVIDGSGRAGLWIGRSKDQACNSSMNHRTRAHDAGFNRAIHCDFG